jgi:hypothetical protein
MTQDLGAAGFKRWATPRRLQSHRHNNRQETLVVDNPLIAFDQAAPPGADRPPADVTGAFHRPA